jgi:hypothetical protein
MEESRLLSWSSVRSHCGLPVVGRGLVSNGHEPWQPCTMLLHGHWLSFTPNNINKTHDIWKSYLWLRHDTDIWDLIIQILTFSLWFYIRLNFLCLGSETIFNLSILFRSHIELLFSRVHSSLHCEYSKFGRSCSIYVYKKCGCCCSFSLRDVTTV